MRALDRGKAFVVTRNGRPVGELVPLRHRAFVPSEFAHAAFVDAPPVSNKRFRRDIDVLIDQTVILRG